MGESSITLGAPRQSTNLPRSLSSFIGREQAVAEVAALLTRASLLTLTCAGGVGKTRLALQVAAGLRDRYPAGVWLVELAPLADPALVPQAVADALGLREEAGRPMRETVLDALASRRGLLLLLDNCEHVLEASIALVVELLRRTDGVQVLATSREALGLLGEHLYRVPSLTLPDLRGASPTAPGLVPALEASAAVRLFVERATAVHPGFQLIEHNAPAVAHICRRLDGIPLAIELAAARMRGLPVAEIAARLDDRFRLLAGGNRAALPRQQTLRALIDWSYDLLTEPERALLRRLSVFVGGFTLQAAESVGSGDTPGANGSRIEAPDILGLLLQLVDKSMVQAEEHEHGAARYRLLATVRQYAAERLMAAGETAAVRDRHLAYYLDVVERVAAGIWGPEQLHRIALLDTEHDNLRAALEWASGEAALRLAGALYWFWYFRGHFNEGRRWLETALAQRAATAPAHRARALLGAALLIRNQGDYGQAAGLLDEALTLFDHLGDRPGTVEALANLGLLAWAQGNFQRAEDLERQSLALARAAGDTRGEILAHLWLGHAVTSLGDLDAAITHYQAGVQLSRSLGVPYVLERSLSFLGNALSRRGEHADAAAILEESLALSRRLGDVYGVGVALIALGDTLGKLDRPARAVALLAEGAELWHRLGSRRQTAWALLALGSAAYRLGGAERLVQFTATAATHFSPIELLQSDMGSAGSPAPVLEVIRARLGESAFGAAWSAGESMSVEAAVEVAQRDVRELQAQPEAISRGSPAAAPDCDAQPSTPDARQLAGQQAIEAAGLTPREVEVLARLGEGRSNAQIAERLVISQRTVNAHLMNIYGKLGVSRAGAIRFAVDCGLA